MKAKPGGDQRLLSVPSVLCQTEEVREDSIRVPSASGADLSSYSTNVKQSEFVWEPSEPVFCLSAQSGGGECISCSGWKHHNQWSTISITNHDYSVNLSYARRRLGKTSLRCFHRGWLMEGWVWVLQVNPGGCRGVPPRLTMVTVTVCPACEASSPPWCRSISVSSPWTTNLLGVKYSSKAEHVCTAAVRKSARSGNTCITFRFRCGAL